MERHQYEREDSESTGMGSEVAELLIWRFAPLESHSDWRIVIQSPSLESTDMVETEYNVHKNLVGLGPYKSEYFDSVFYQQAMCSARNSQQQRQQPLLEEAQTSTSWIQLDAQAAACVPVVLDFIYSRGLVQDFNQHNAASVKHLASYFGVKRLLKSVQAFIDHDMQETTCITYLQEATAYHDTDLAYASKAMCAQRFEQLTKDDILSLPPALFLDVVTCEHLKCGSQELSCKVSEYCKAHEDLITPDWLEREEHDWDSNKGLMKSAGGLTFIQVYEAGHMVPSDQPEAALDLIKQFTAGDI